MESKSIIMAGGKGTRLWPVSRKNKPKQFQALLSDKTMLQETFLRLRKKYEMNDIYISTNTEYVSEVEREILELPKKNIIGEPEARGTASSIALASAFVARESGEDTILSIFPSDHFIRHEDALFRAIEKAEAFLQENPDFIVTFGVVPNYPETGYGYIKKGEAAPGNDHGVALVDRFVEKPDAVTAEKYLSEGSYLWNSGMYVFRVGAMLDKIGKYIPDTHKRAMKILESSDKDIEKAIAAEYSQMDKINIEYAVVENDPSVVVIPVDLGWSDVGSWSALKDTLTMDDVNGHFAKGEHVDFGGENLLVYGSKKLIVTVGIKDVVIIDTDDAILICDKHRTGQISEVVKELEESGHKVV